MKKNLVYIDDIDLPWDDTNDTFEGMLEKLAEKVPSAFVKVNRFVGSGGGWPQGEVVVAADEARDLFAFFGIDEGDLEYRLGHAEPIESASN